MRFTGTDQLLIEPLSLNAVAAANSIFQDVCLSSVAEAALPLFQSFLSRSFLALSQPFAGSFSVFIFINNATLSFNRHINH